MRKGFWWKFKNIRQSVLIARRVQKLNRNETELLKNMEIECKFEIPEYSSEPYRCEVDKASITEPNVHIARFKGKHQPGKNNNHVTRVTFVTARVEYFPRNLQLIFQNLTTLGLHNCGLRIIHREDLIGLKRLVYLNLGFNQLKSLPDDLFSKMPKLKGVWLQHNKIKFASSKVIKPSSAIWKCFLWRETQTLTSFIVQVIGIVVKQFKS